MAFSERTMSYLKHGALHTINIFVATFSEHQLREMLDQQICNKTFPTPKCQSKSANLYEIKTVLRLSNHDAEKVRAILDRERHLVMVVAIVLVAFLICWSPFWLAQMVLSTNSST